MYLLSGHITQLEKNLSDIDAEHDPFQTCPSKKKDLGDPKPGLEKRVAQLEWQLRIEEQMNQAYAGAMGQVQSVFE